MLSAIRNTFFILASASPRRIEFLKNLNLNFKVVKSNFVEKEHDKVAPEALCMSNATGKALKVSKANREILVVGCDTIVTINGIVLGKPFNKKNCIEMLKMLSNNNHNVLTAYSFVKNSKVLRKNIVKTTVGFKKLTDEEINWYISTREPFDKAGAYAIQGIGAFMVKNINGSYSNVVGLPLAEFLDDFNRVISNEH